MLFRYSRNRSGGYPVEHLEHFSGIRYADIHVGYNALYEAGRLPGSVIEAACWSPSRRKPFELAVITLPPLSVFGRKLRSLLHL